MRLTELLLEKDETPYPAHEQQAAAIADIRKRKQKEEDQRARKATADGRKQETALNREAGVEKARAEASKAFWQSEAQRHKAEAKQAS